MINETLHEPQMLSSCNVQLPPELIITILRHAFIGDTTTYLTSRGIGEVGCPPPSSTRERLKQIRLEGRVFHDAVTPLVFATIHIHASQLSITRAENIACSRLNTHVREIVHHCGTFQHSMTQRQTFLRILGSHQRRQDYPKQLKDADKEEFYQNFLQEVEAAGEFENAGGFSDYDYQRLVDKLPN